MMNANVIYDWIIDKNVAALCAVAGGIVSILSECWSKWNVNQRSDVIENLNLDKESRERLLRYLKASESQGLKVKKASINSDGGIHIIFDE